MPIKLASFPETFGLSIRDKGFFPYLFNRSENLDAQLTTLPPKKGFAPHCMTKPQREEFEAWYEQNYGNGFHLAEELAAYCCNDTNILLHGVVAMQKAFYSITKLDIFKSKTIASAVMKHFQTNHLPNSEHLALITERAYSLDRHFKQSSLAKKYLKWRSIKEEMPIQTSETFPGEKKIGTHYVDGFINRWDRTDGCTDRDLAVEVHGCFYHACPVHYPNDDQLMLDGTTAANVREKNARREQQIRDEAPDLDFKIIWECEVIDCSFFRD